MRKWEDLKKILSKSHLFGTGTEFWQLTPHGTSIYREKIQSVTFRENCSCKVIYSIVDWTSGYILYMTEEDQILYIATGSVLWGQGNKDFPYIPCTISYQRIEDSYAIRDS